MNPITIVVIVLWAFAVARFCSYRGKNVVLGLGIFAVIVAVMVFLIHNSFMPATLSGLATYGIMAIIPQRATDSTAVARAAGSAPACPQCGKPVTAGVTRCLECGRSLA